MSLFSRVRIVLVETTHPGNVGSAARAMKNMGLSKLVLVNPRDFPGDKARWRAAGAVDVVDGATVTAGVDDAIGDCNLVIATSARDRRIPWPLLDPVECAEKVIHEARGGGDVAILFGRESRGLRNDELQKCHYHVTIPTGEDYSSLNLAMAVQIICYEIHRASRRETTQTIWDVPHATARETEQFFQHLESTLTRLGFLDPANPRQLMTRLRRLFNRIRLDRMEVNILRGILSAMDRKDGDHGSGKD